MNQINFLPETFRKNRARMRRRPIEFAVIAGAALALLGLWQTASGPDPALAAQARQIEQDIEAIEQLQNEQAGLEKQRSELQRRLLIARETYQPISVTQVLARLSERAPEAVRFVALELNTVRPEPEAAPGKAAGKPKRVIGQPAGEPEQAARQPHLMKIEITGHAPSDDEVVTLIRRLGEDPVFNAVALRSSRVEQTDTHFVREFRLDLIIDLNRRFVPSKPKAVNDED